MKQLASGLLSQRAIIFLALVAALDAASFALLYPHPAVPESRSCKVSRRIPHPWR